MRSSFDEDLYSGYNDYHSAFNTKDIEKDEYLQEALKSSHGTRSKLTTAFKTPGTTSRYREGTGFSFRPVTGRMDSAQRPMTAVSGAGYTSQRRGPSGFVGGTIATAMSRPDLQSERIEDRIKRHERGIMTLIDESCTAAAKKEYQLALERAKEASSKEKNLIRLQDQSGLGDSHNIDLTFLVLFNLASQYENNDMNNEALNTYSVITRNRMFQNSNQLKVNMGNIYAKAGQIPKAIKMYRMALDQVPNTYKDLRVKIMHNIGLLFVRLGQYNDACNSFEYIMQEKPDFKAGLYTLLCHYAMGDKDKMKQSFKNLLEVPLDIDEDRYIITDSNVSNKLVIEMIRDDKLSRLEKKIKFQAHSAILTAAKLISPAIDINYNVGYNWCVEAVSESSHGSLAGELEVNKALAALKQGSVSEAVDLLKALHKRGDARLATTAATNLAFIYYLQGNLDDSEKYGELAKSADSYNAGAYVNLGNVALARSDMDRAKSLYLVALENDPSSIEALYNLGLVHKRQGEYEDALDYFLKLHSILSSHPPVLYQLAHLHQLVGDLDQAIEWFLQLLSIVPSDPSILQKLGEIYDSDNDKQQAYHYHYEAYRYLPSELSVLDWLGAYYITHRVPEKAIPFYEKAALMQPSETKWPLLVGSCYRRAGNYQAALKTYKDTLAKFPGDIECLKFLVRLCSDLGLKETNDYAMELKRAEKAKEVRERISSSRSGSRRSSGRSSNGRGGASPGQSDSPLQSAAYKNHQSVVIDAGYSDPLGPLQERPRTGMAHPRTPWPAEDEFADEEITADLLPE